MSDEKRLGIVFQPYLFVEADLDGSNPRIVDIDWMDTYQNTVLLPDQTFLHENDGHVAIDETERVTDWIDGLRDKLLAAWQEVASCK